MNIHVYFIIDWIVCAGCRIKSQDLVIIIFHVIDTNKISAEWYLRYTVYLYLRLFIKLNKILL